MANKRMFTMKIVDSDAFLDMPLSTQCLYFHLNMRADDDGFIGNPKRIMRIIGASEDDLRLLIAKRFVLTFEDGVIVIKHWRMHNTLSQNRYHETQYVDEKKCLRLKENGAYSFNSGAEIDDAKLKDAKRCKRLTNGLQTADSDLGLDLGIDKDIDIDRDKEINNNSCAAKQHDTDSKNKILEKFFESIWKLYPIKKGKGQVSKTKKQVLQRIGYEEIKRCIERFVRDMEEEGRDRRYWMHGSTFFNSGYVDYLDKNYLSDIQRRKPEPKPTEEEEEELPEEDGKYIDFRGMTDEEFKEFLRIQAGRCV